MCQVQSDAVCQDVPQVAAAWLVDVPLQDIL